MEPTTVISLVFGVIAGVNELLGYSPVGWPKNISQSLTLLYKTTKNYFTAPAPIPLVTIKIDVPRKNI